MSVALAWLAVSPQPALALDKAAGAPKAARPSAQQASAVTSGAATYLHRAEFGRAVPSRNTRHIADWIVDSGDNERLPFAIIDKQQAKLFVFEPDGRLRGAAPVLLGQAVGDHTVPGIGDRELSDIKPEERTTPAGRFVAERGVNARGEDVVWVDYEAGVSMHRVIHGNRTDRRFERLATPTPADNRISFGCINVPIAFFDKVLKPTFTATNGIVYVLPEVRPVREVFGSYEPGERTVRRTANSAAPARAARPVGVKAEHAANDREQRPKVLPTL